MNKFNGIIAAYKAWFNDMSTSEKIERTFGTLLLIGCVSYLMF